MHGRTLDFLGHAIALYTNNSFKVRPAIEVLKKLKLYINSIGRFGKSPFIYPIYGLSGISESFARKSALHGGTYMLGVQIKKLERIGSKYRVSIQWENNLIVFYTKKIVANPKYMIALKMEDRVK